MPLQPRYATPWPQGKREPIAPTAATTIAAGDPGREPVPETVDAPLCLPTRHASDGGSFDHPRRSLGIFPGRPRAVTLIREEFGKTPFQPVPSGSVRMSAYFAATGYKMHHSGGFLSRAAGSAGVQDVTFAGVFVPQGWNQQGNQSASRMCPVGVWLRLYHALPVSFLLFDSPCKYMYTSRTSPETSNSACPERQAAH